MSSSGVTNLVMFVLQPLCFLDARDKNCTQIASNGLLLVASYCVVVQFDSDINAVQNKRIEWMLRSFDCNNCAAKYCGKYCNSLTMSTAESDLAETVRKDSTIDSGPESAENGTVELGTMGHSVNSKD